MTGPLTEVEKAALNWRLFKERLERHTCGCDNCLWVQRILIGQPDTPGNG